MPAYSVAAFYEFTEWSEPMAVDASDWLQSRARELGLVGLCVTGTEGVNCTCAGERPQVEALLSEARSRLGLELSNVKWSESDRPPFAKFRAPLRPEIVTLGDPALSPKRSALRAKRAAPSEFREALNDPEAAVVDTRNWYESKIGKFKGAIEPGIDEFRQFGEWLKTAPLDRERRTYVYCTGGIRCEKAALEMERQGFRDVRQLDGGILKYLEEFPDEGFEGECFVFDRRVAVDRRLRPSALYSQCPHCGQPAKAEDAISCVRCGDPARVCASCRSEPRRQTCSRNCAHHWALAPGKRGRSQRSAERARRPLSAPTRSTP